MKGKALKLIVGVIILVSFFGIDICRGQQLLLKDKSEKLRRKFEKDRSTIEAQSRGKRQPKKRTHFFDSVGINIDSEVPAGKNNDHVASTSSASRHVKAERYSHIARKIETNFTSDAYFSDGHIEVSAVLDEGFMTIDGTINLLLTALLTVGITSHFISLKV